MITSSTFFVQFLFALLSTCKKWVLPTATYHPLRKLSKLDEPGIRDTAGELGKGSFATYSCGPLDMDEQWQDDQLEPTYSSFV